MNCRYLNFLIFLFGVNFTDHISGMFSFKEKLSVGQQPKPLVRITLSDAEKESILHPATPVLHGIPISLLKNHNDYHPKARSFALNHKFMNAICAHHRINYSLRKREKKMKSSQDRISDVSSKI